jgi:hypothetical protein
VVKFIDLTHGVVEDGGDDAAVAVTGGSGVALAEAELADEDLAGFVEGEFQAHAVGIVLAAGEAVVLLQLDVAGVVALGLGLSGHGGILTPESDSCCKVKIPTSCKRGEKWGTRRALHLRRMTACF